MNFYVMNIRNQIINTCEILQKKGLIMYYNSPLLLDGDSIKQKIISFPNYTYKPEDLRFNTVNHYREIIKYNSFNCILGDLSIVKAYFRFEGSILIEQSISWIPSPFTGDEFKDMMYEFDEMQLTPTEIIDYYLSLKFQDVCNHLRMRTPLRFDFDSKNDTSIHPRAHMHFQHDHTRISLNEPICFNRFIKSLFEFVYPRIDLDLDVNDNITLKTCNLKGYKYTTSHLNLGWI